MCSVNINLWNFTGTITIKIHFCHSGKYYIHIFIHGSKTKMNHCIADNSWPKRLLILFIWCTASTRVSPFYSYIPNSLSFKHISCSLQHNCISLQTDTFFHLHISHSSRCTYIHRSVNFTSQTHLTSTTHFLFKLSTKAAKPFASAPRFTRWLTRSCQSQTALASQMAEILCWQQHGAIMYTYTFCESQVL